MKLKPKHILFLLFFFLLSISCSSQKNSLKENILSDKLATEETTKLYQNLISLKNKGYLFGHQDDLAYGVKWKYEEGRSDVKDVTQDYPALFGWDLGGIEHQKANNIDGVPFEKIKKWCKEYYKKGAVITISWHIDNPLTLKNSWDVTNGSLASILPNGTQHNLYKLWLDNAANYLKEFKTNNGKPIPLLYRPFHELTGNWFWWCKNNGTPEQFTELWKFTINYLRNEKKLHNLIIVYNTADFKSKEEFLEYYPGDDYVDFLSFDKYQYTDPTKDNSYINEMQRQLEIMNNISLEKNKPMAIAEAGYEQIPYANWWTDTLNKAIGNYKISYILVWRNHGWIENEKKMHYYAPNENQVSAKDFINYYNQDNTLFLKDITKENLYK